MGSSNSESTGVQYGANQCRKNFQSKIYLRKIFSYVLCLRKYFYNEHKADYGTLPQLDHLVEEMN